MPLRSSIDQRGRERWHDSCAFRTSGLKDSDRFGLRTALVIWRCDDRFPVDFYLAVIKRACIRLRLRVYESTS